MLCITGNERTVAELRTRLTDERVPADAMHEIRLDALEPFDHEVYALIRQHAERLLVCCRPERQGGAFRGPDADRIGMLIAPSQTCWIDLEADAYDESMRGLQWQRVLLSLHDFDGIPHDLDDRVQQMAARRPAGIKIACAVQDAAELRRLRRACQQAVAGSELLYVVIGMGEAGRLSRTHYASFGSAWTYIAYDSKLSTAPGQIDLATALAMGMPASASAPLCALVGGPQVMSSPGEVVYNRLFRQLGLRQSYVSVVTTRLAETAALLEELGVIGLSVTMPLKEQALALGDADELASRLGAVNTLTWLAEGWIGSNTDVAGVLEPLRSALEEMPGVSDALILGAGGAARAAVDACAQLGLETVVAARHREKAQAISGSTVCWDDRTQAAGGILINATPLVGPDRSPWPDDAPLDATIVFDLAIGPRPSKLLSRAHAAKRVLDAREMWVHQGAAQMSLFLDRVIQPETLRELLP